MTNFSKEIQGIRAIAVLAVVLFHFGFYGLDGGYLGVDIFFVISGYLIGQIIMKDLATNQFSLINFYKNRVVRLFPNLLLMLLVSIIISWLLLRPYDFFQFGKSLQFSGLYVTNIVFSKQQGYFDISREFKPLLHTWSLSIEEQFYLFLPIFLIFIQRIKLKIKLIIFTIIIAISFIYKWWLIQALPINSFFSFPGRVWELGLGVLLAYLPTKIKEKLHGRSILASLSLLTIIIYLITLEESITYAGVISAGCCIATGILILTSPNTWVGMLLSKSYIVYIGTISYSLYLWHWLVLIAFKNSEVKLNPISEFFAMSLISLLIAHLAWKYVEEPIRKRRQLFSRKQIFISAFLFTSIAAAGGGYIYARNGFPERFPNYIKVSENINSFNWKVATGFEVSNKRRCSLDNKGILDLTKCMYGDMKSSRTVLVIGDSHAASLRQAFDIAGQISNTKVLLLTGTGCPPLLNVKSFNGPIDICKKNNFDSTFSKILESQALDKVYLIAYWDMYANGNRSHGRLLRPNHFISNTETPSQSEKASQEAITYALIETILKINNYGLETVLVEDVPSLPKKIQELPIGFSQNKLDIQDQQIFIKNFLFNNKINRLNSIDLAETICIENTCQTYKNGFYLYTDKNHLSPAGSALTIPVLVKSLNN